jgi:hypothetical protein
VRRPHRVLPSWRRHRFRRSPLRLNRKER